MKTALYILGKLVHNLQLERGRVAVYLSSEGGLFVDSIHNQFKNTDTCISTFSDNLKIWKTNEALKPENIRKLEFLLDICNSLSQMRDEIILNKRLTYLSIDFYSHELISPLIQSIIEIAWLMPDTNPTSLSAYNAFLQWEERIGLERAICSRGFIKNSFENQEFIERILSLLSEQNNFQNTFFALATPAQRNIAEHILQNKACLKIDYFHGLFKSQPNSLELKNLSLNTWFDLVTEKMDALHTIEPPLIDTLCIHHDQTATAPTPKVESPRLHAAQRTGKLEPYFDLIQSLQLFSGIKPENLEILLNNGQVRKLEKGKLLFLEGEAPNRLYIILSGWVKIYKGTADGDETILQMLSAGDSILESAVYLNTSFPMSAQIVEDCEILSIPAPILREQLRQNNDLALNLLSSMSYRSQSLIRQIESARLKSVDERVGWFLLQLLMENGRKDKRISLPYDKSMIASYLDMKRETFSRALQRLKAKNFIIENDRIIIPDIASLCDFCDEKIAADCPTSENCTKFGLDEFDQPQKIEYS